MSNNDELTSFDPDEIMASWEKKPLRQNGQRYEDETRGKVLAALAVGGDPALVAKEFGISVATIHSWLERYPIPPASNPETSLTTAEIRAAITEQQITEALEMRQLLGGKLFGYLIAALDTMESQVIFARNPAWLAKQNAHDVGILHGIIADKATRLLAAIQPGGHADVE